MAIFMNAMGNEWNLIKSRRLKFVRRLMYLDVLLLLLSVIMFDVQAFSWKTHSGICFRLLVLSGVFLVLLAVEKSLLRYLRKHRGE